MNKIPRLPEWCSHCRHPEAWKLPPGPCEFHKGEDGKPREYTGADAYDPSNWVLVVVGGIYRSWDTILYVCVGYDPRHGFWMHNIYDPNAREPNISEAAIGRTYHPVWPDSAEYKRARAALDSRNYRAERGACDGF